MNRSRLAAGALPLAAALALGLPLSPASATSAETTRYLAPREDAAASGTGFREAPSDVETPVDWRRGVPGNEATDRGYRSPAGALSAR